MSRIVLRAVGDNLIQTSIYEAAKRGDTYFFDDQYSEVRALIKEADIAIVDQETILVEDRKEITGFPRFGTPYEAADALVNAGFNVVMQGTNHALDKGYKGIVGDIGIWKKYEDKIKLIGIYDNEKKAVEIPVVEKNGIKVALLNYTESLNLHRRPLFKSYCVNTMKPGDKGKIRRDIKRARELADVVIILPHWGVEYLYEPVERQKKWARFFAECGADLIIGTHPHVLQYQENIKTGDGRNVPCFFSLGNFISEHMNLRGVVIGGMADVKIEMDDSHHIRITRADIIPTVTHTDKKLSFFKVMKLSDYTNDLASENGLLDIINIRFNDQVDADRLRDIFSDIMERRALAKSMFKKPSDVFFFNLMCVILQLRKNKK